MALSNNWLSLPDPQSGYPGSSPGSATMSTNPTGRGAGLQNLCSEFDSHRGLKILGENMKIQVIIKNKYSSEFNNRLIKKGIKLCKLDMNTIKKIYITDRIVNFVTK